MRRMGCRLPLHRQRLGPLVLPRSRWERVRAFERQNYLKNAYRVLLTRARQGMVVVVPEGDTSDPTRSPTFYDPTYDYLASMGLELLGVSK